MRLEYIKYEFFNTNPDILLKYSQVLIDIIVKSFIKSQLFSPDDFDDIKQEVNLHLVGKIELIIRNYKPEYKMKTYISRIIQNKCLELARSKKNIYGIDGQTEKYQGTDISVEDKYIIREYSQKLQYILKSFRRDFDKMLLCLKLYFGVRIEEKDITCFSLSKAEILDSKILLGRHTFHGLQMPRERKALYQILTDFFNLAENSFNMQDAIRIYIKGRIKKIITRLNGIPPESNFDEDSLELLFREIYK
jgi:hypothetical protein